MPLNKGGDAPAPKPTTKKLGLDKTLKTIGKITAKPAVKKAAKEIAKGESRQRALALSRGTTTSETHAVHKEFGITGPFRKQLTQSSNEATSRAQRRKLTRVSAGEITATGKYEPKPFAVGHTFPTKEAAVAQIGKVLAARYEKDSQFRKSLDLDAKGDHKAAFAAAPKDIQAKVAGLRNKPVKVSGITLPGSATKVLRTIGATEVNIAKSVATHPGATIGKVPEALKGVAGGVVGAAAIPVELAISGKSPVAAKLWKDVKKDYATRYGAVWRNEPGAVKEQLQRMKRDGALPEILDIGGLAAPVAGQAAGAAARTGVLGKTAHAISTAPRAKLVTAGGVVREQALSRNLAKAAIQKGVEDKLRKVSTKRAEKKGGERPLAAAVPDAEGALVSLGARNKAIKALSRASAKEKRDVAQVLGRAHEGLLIHQHREIKGRKSFKITTPDGISVKVDSLMKNLKTLSRDEKQGYKYAVQLGIRSTSDIRAALDRRIEQIRTGRESNGNHYIGNEADELTHLTKLAALPDETLRAKVFTPKLDSIADQEVARGARLGHQDPSLVPDQIAHRSAIDQATFLGTAPKRTTTPDGTAGPKESGRQFAERVQKLAEENGLAKGGYWPSMKRIEEQPSVFASGSTGRAVRSDKPRSGINFELGREAWDPQVFVSGLAKNIKRRYNWDAVAEIASTKTIKEVTDRATGETIPFPARGVSIDEAKTAMRRAGVPDSEIAYINMGRLATIQKELHDLGDAPDAHVESQADEQMAASVQKSIVMPDTPGAEFTPMDRFLPVSRAVAEELQQGFSPPKPLARGLQTLTRIQTGAILGLSPSWAAFQVASNLATNIIARPTSLPNIIRNKRLYNKLSPEERQVVDVWAGNGPSAEQVTGVRIATRNGAEMSRHAEVASIVGQRIMAWVKDPLLLFRFDRMQTHAFRRNFMMDDLRRQSITRLSRNMADTVPLHERINQVIGKATPDGIRDVISERANIERAAVKLRDAMGDFTSYTHAERTYLRSNLIFYGYLRYSLRLAFYTLPIKHPVMGSILAQLGRLNAEEVKSLIGPNLPFALGTYVLSGGQMHLDLSRANPLTNSLTELFGGGEAGRAAGMLPPLYGALIEQVAGKDLYKGTDLTVLDDNGFRQGLSDYEKEHGVAWSKRLRMLGAKLTATAWPLRQLDKLQKPGTAPVSESIPVISPRVPKEASPELIVSLERQKQSATKGLLAIAQDFPGVPKPTKQLKEMSRRKVQEKEALKQAAQKRLLRSLDPESIAKLQEDVIMERILRDPKTGERIDQVGNKITDDIYLSLGLLPPGR